MQPINRTITFDLSKCWIVMEFPCTSLNKYHDHGSYIVVFILGDKSPTAYKKTNSNRTYWKTKVYYLILTDMFLLSSEIFANLSVRCALMWDFAKVCLVLSSCPYVISMKRGVNITVNGTCYSQTFSAFVPTG